MRKLLLPLLLGSLVLVACSEEEMQELGSTVQKLSHEHCVRKAMAEYEVIDGLDGFENESPEEAQAFLRQVEELMGMIDVSDCPASFKVPFVAFKGDIADLADLIDQVVQEPWLLPSLEERAQSIIERGDRHEKMLKETAASFGWQPTSTGNP